MAESKTEIANLALIHIGVSPLIEDLEQDDGEEALTVNAVYDVALKAVIRGMEWPFTRKFRTLSLIAEDPTSEWSFSYSYPSDCERFVRIIGAGRNPNHEEKIPFLIAQGSGSSRIILTDQSDAEAEYRVREDDPVQYPEDFTLALSYKIAALIAPKLADGDSFVVAREQERLFIFHWRIAAATAFNEDQREPEPPSELETSR